MKTQLTFNCTDCGKPNEVTIDLALMRATPVPAWGSKLLDSTVSSLLAEKFSKVEGEFGPEGAKKKFRTLFLATTKCVSLVDILNDSIKEEEMVAEAYGASIVPAIEKVAANFKILGSLTPPSCIQLAQMDLISPACVICFVTVEDEDGLQEKLDRLGLPRVTVEGPVDTLGDQEWSWLGRSSRTVNVQTKTGVLGGRLDPQGEFEECFEECSEFARVRIEAPRVR